MASIALGHSAVLPAAMPCLRPASFLPLALMAAEASTGRTEGELVTGPLVPVDSAVRRPLAKRQRTTVESADDPDSRALSAVLAGWVAVLRRLGRGAVSFAPATDWEGEELQEDVCAMLFGKAASTLQKRLHSIESYLWWCNSSSLPESLTMQYAKRYLIELRDSGAAPTKAQAFRESVAFLHGHFCLVGGDDLISDRVLRGLAWQSLSAGGPSPSGLGEGPGGLCL